MKRNSLWIALVALCSLIVAAACQPISPDTPFDDGHAGSATSSFGIEGTSWQLSSYRDGDTMADVPADVAITADFGTDGTLFSRACNSINATFVADGTMLTISPGAMTLMACEGPLGEIETVYVRALGDVASHDVSSGILSMSNADGTVLLEFVSGDAAAADAGAAALDGTHWILTDYGSDNSVFAVPDGVEVSASFEDGMHFARVCNNIRATYSTEGNAITFGPGLSTMMMCEEPLMTIETAYLGALENAATWSQTGSELLILNANGGVLLGFTDDTSVIADPAHVQDGSDLAGTSWQVTGYLNDGALATPDSSFTATLVFGDDDTYSGQVCNGYSGAYTAEGNTISFGPAVMTMMACMGPVGEFEPVFHTLLASATGFEMVGNELSLWNDAGDVLLQFATYTPPTLEGPTWNAAGINNGQQAVVGLVEGTSVTATFADGTVSGNAGCNNYSAGYTLDGNTLTIGPAASTMMFCAEPEGVMEQEANFLTALGNVATWEIANYTLWLRDSEDAQQVNFIP